MKLPATRELAQTLGVNRGTVAEAYEELVAAGWALPAAPALPVNLSLAVRPRGAARRDPDRQRLAAGVRPDRAHPRGPGRHRRDRATHVPARAPGVPVLRRPARARAVGRGGAARGSLRAPARAPRAEALLLPAERAQPDRPHAPARDRTTAARGGRAPPSADRRGRLRREP